jgi:hypothetical protein
MQARGGNLQTPPKESQNPTKVMVSPIPYVSCGLTIAVLMATSVGSNMRDQELARPGV